MAGFCLRCQRPSLHFGVIDTSTGWIGWCDLCNLEWKYREVKSLLLWRVLKKKVESELEQIIISFLVGEGASLTKLQSQRRDRTKAALCSLWKNLLVRYPIYIRDDSEVRTADSDDENDFGFFDADLDFCNPFWKLRLARRVQLDDVLQRVPEHDDFTGRPLRIVIDFLGMPPWMACGKVTSGDPLRGRHYYRPYIFCAGTSKQGIRVSAVDYEGSRLLVIQCLEEKSKVASQSYDLLPCDVHDVCYQECGFQSLFHQFMCHATIKGTGPYVGLQTFGVGSNRRKRVRASRLGLAILASWQGYRQPLSLHELLMPLLNLASEAFSRRLQPMSSLRMKSDEVDDGAVDVRVQLPSLHVLHDVSDSSSSKLLPATLRSWAPATPPLPPVPSLQRGNTQRWFATDVR